MDSSSIYHEGNRRLQDRFDSRRIADRLDQVTLHDRFTPGDVAFIEQSAMFFLATADADGWPDVSYKGGLPGFVRVTGESELAFACYDGNGMFKSSGNILVNPKVGLLFIDFEGQNRMRVQGTASISDDDPLMAKFPGALLIIGVKAERIFPNCPVHPQAADGRVQRLRTAPALRTAGTGLEAHACLQGRAAEGGPGGDG